MQIDPTVLRRAQNNDAAAMMAVVKAARPVAMAAALAVLASVDDAEDAAQEALVAVVRQLGELREPPAFLAWVRGIARHKALSRARVRHRVAPLSDEVADASADVEALIERGERRAAVQRAVDALPEPSREAVMLFYWEGLSTAAVAAALGTSEEALRQRLTRARRALKMELLASMAIAWPVVLPPELSITTLLGTVPASNTPRWLWSRAWGAGAVGAGAAVLIAVGVGTSARATKAPVEPSRVGSVASAPTVDAGSETRRVGGAPTHAQVLPEIIGSSGAVLAAIDKNMTFDSRTMSTTMTNVKGGRTRVFKMSIQSKGEDTAAIEYVDPPREAGTKMLRVGDELWMYLPSVSKTEKIGGHMLRQGMMGTDVSYEDMMAAGDLASAYDATVVAAEDCGVDAAGVIVPSSGRMCWKLEMTAKDPSVSYPKRTAWIDQEHSIAVRQELFAVSGTILKTWTMGGIQQFDGTRWFPTKMTITDELQADTSTTLEFADVKFSVALADEVFSMRWLERGN